MTDLPKHLQPWAQELSAFPKEVVLTLAPYLPKLSMAMGPLRARRLRGDGEPDGFSGLSRKGPYDRLLLSHWAVAQVHPFEFLRRAAMSEHSFYELARLEPAGSQRSCALFDAGPSQLGAPRLAHIAALIVLARRARTAGAEFLWAVLQDGAHGPYEAITEKTVKGMLKARQSREARPSDLSEWLPKLRSEHAETSDEHPDDLWLIGAERLSMLPPKTSVQKASLLAIEEQLAPQARALDLHIHRDRSVAPLRIELQLPPPDAATRLIRNPFEGMKKPRKKRRRHAPLSISSNLLFTHDGRRLLMKTVTGALMIPVPNAYHAHVGKPRSLSANDEQLVAVGAVRKVSYLITSDSNRVRVLSYSKRARLQRMWQLEPIVMDTPFWHPGAQTPVMPCLGRSGRSYPAALLFLDAPGRLYSVPLDYKNKTMKHLASSVTALARVQGRVLAVIAEDEVNLKRRVVRIDGADDLHDIVRDDLEGDGDMQAFFGFGGPYLPQGVGALAMRTHADQWLLLHSGRKSVEIPIAADRQVIGVSTHEDNHQEAGLIVLENDRMTFQLITGTQERMLHTATAQVTTATASQSASTFAYLTTDGQLIAQTLSGRMLLEYWPGAPQEEETS